MTVTTKSTPVGEDGRPVPPPIQPPPVQQNPLPPPVLGGQEQPDSNESSGGSAPKELKEEPGSSEEVAGGALTDSGFGSKVVDDESLEVAEVEIEFPMAEMSRLDEMINRPRWVVPVLAKGELEILLDASLDLCRKGLDTRCEGCQRFFRDGLTISFSKILTDEAVSGWKYEIQRCILKNTEKLIELCVLKLDEDWFPLLDMLAIAFNPSARFHMFNASRPSEHLPPTSGVAPPTSPNSPNPPSPTPDSDESLYACCTEPRVPKGWLCDLINLFGSLNGFEILVKRFERNLSVPVVAALIRPFGSCYEVLTTNTVKKYFTPIIDTVSKFLENLTDDELKRDSKAEGKNDMLSVIINALKCLASRLPQQEQRIRELEMFRLNVILRLLQISSFNGKMNALNEVNKLIGNVTYNVHKHNQSEFDEWLTADKVAEWIEKNNVLSIVLRDSLHQPQYVEKLEKIVRFMIKEKALSLADLDKIWDAQTGKHEAIVKNVHDLLAKLAWDFSPQQLDHLFECFQESWQNASKKQREKLLELIRRLAEDDKEGIMANKVLTLLWNLAQSDDVTTDIMDQALAAHIKILDYSSSQVCVQDRDSQKFDWISKFVEELNNDRLVIPALKQIREICQLFTEAPQNYAHVQRSSQMCYRNKVINQLHTNYSIVIRVANSLVEYMGKARKYITEHPDIDPLTYLPDGRFSHIQQVNERLRFLRFLLKDGQLWLCKPQVNEIWSCLAENAIYPTDREHCFKWFSKLMGDEPDLDPDITSEFFQQYVLKFDPALLTESGMICFERFFRQVNSKEGKLIPKRRGGYYMDDLNLIGIEYLWKVVSNGPEEVTEKAIILLKDIYTSLGPRLQSKQVEIHEDFLQDCMNRLKAMYDTVKGLLSERNNDNETRIQQEAVRMIRILSVLRVYVAECDEGYVEERAILPLHRACRGKHITLIVRFPNQGRQAEDVEVWSHTNDTIASVRRHLVHRAKSGMPNLRAELYLNGEIIDTSHDRKLICVLGIRDKTQLTAKLVQVGSNNPSSPESSSGSSTGSLHQLYDGPNLEAESTLPGVLMAHRLHYTEFLFSLTDLGTLLDLAALRDAAKDILRLLPADAQTVERLRTLCAETVNQMNSANNSSANAGVSGHSPGVEAHTSSLESLFFNSAPAKVLYCLEVTYALLMPAYGANTDENWEFQNNFMLSGGVSLCLKMITSSNFLSNADLSTKRSAYLTVLKIAKLMLTAVGFAQVQVVAEACQGDGQSGSQISPAQHNQAVLLQKALQCIPNTGSECVTRNTASKLGHCLSRQAIGVMPDSNTMRCLQKLAWSSGGECLHLVHSTCEEIHKAFTLSAASAISEERQQMDEEDINVCREALEVLTVCLALCPDAVETMYKEKSWQNFIIGLLLTCRCRAVRISATEQFYLIATRTTGSHRIIVFFITLLFTVLSSTAKDFASQSVEYFQLLCRLLSFSYASNVALPTADSLLNNEIIWLKKIHDQVQTTGSLQVDEALLDGHLGITKELVSLQTPAKKYHIGCESGGHNLIKELVEDFVFSSSKVLLVCRRQQGDIQQLDQQSVAVCNTPQTIMTCLELLVTLVTGCLPNLKYLSELLTNMFYTGNEPVLVEWEFIPPVGPRPHKGFVGLKNAGATCYMNSVIQQLFMIDQIRDTILTAEGAADDSIEAEEMEEKPEAEPQLEFVDEDRMSRSGENENKNAQTGCVQDERKEYHIKVLRYVQLIFAHLAYSKLQYYVPKGFWKHFRLQGEQVNLREQHDALEFFNSLVDSLDEALKAFGYKPMLTKVLGGSFADQKICKGCPHRYSREEPFTALNIDIRNHQNLVDSLEQYVKGDLLEGANAYHCEKCNKKVDTVKRLCIKKLPPILAIQLKRFDYDWERECAMKFNDYFEFPRDLDMAPYTVQGLANIEGEAIADENEDGEKESENSMSSTKYRLVGVVVHSGQASGGHYYSYILHRYGDEPPRWYKFDDGEVSECKMDDDEDMKNQCFGGEYMGEVFDHMLKRMSYRRQKRWWNAYILFYEQIGQQEETVTEEKLVKTLYDLSIGGQNAPGMPAQVERCVRKQNIQYLHNKNQFCPEYFRFMRRLLLCNSYTGQLPAGDDKMSSEAEEISMISVQLVSTFLFNVGFHTKKTLRGAAGDWYEALSMHLRHSRAVRNWFIQNVLFSHAGRVAEYLLECPSTEVRNAFMRLIVFVAHFSLQDGPCPPQLAAAIAIINEPKWTASDHILVAILQLLKKDVSEHGRHPSQYFNLFQTYANLGVPEKQQLLMLKVPEQFMSVTMDDGSIPSIKYQYAELNKLYTVVSQLVRCCDVSARCKSSIPGRPVLPNPYGEVSLKAPLMKIQPAVADMLFERPNYVKKLIQDCNNFEETTKLLRFCCWENPHFSVTVLNELLWQVAYSCTYELKPYLDLLLQTLKLEDSWQNHRIHNALKGIPDERDGLFDTIQVSRTQYQKRAYQCIKMMVLLFSECQTAAELLSKQIDLKRKFTSAVEWLHDELERRPYPGNPQYTYNNWSAQAQSNETSNGYFLERSNSAKLTLAKALELCPEEETDEVEMSGVVEENSVVSNEESSCSPPGCVSSGHPIDNVTPSGQDSDTPSSSQGPSSANSTTTLTDTGTDIPLAPATALVSQVSDVSPPLSPVRSQPIGQALMGEEFNANVNNSANTVESSSTTGNSGDGNSGEGNSVDSVEGKDKNYVVE